MSLYMHHPYAHIPPSSSGYPQLGGYQYQQPAPPPPPVYYTDAVSFRRDYTSQLAELTVNSRPIIQHLSTIAQEYMRWADVVAQCLESHIRRVPVWMKLPAFYLLDAISKNVYEPYARHFTAFVIPLFLEAYDQVDQNTRSKMEEMLLTWRTGGPGGKELFGVSAQVAIERGVWGGDSSHGADPQPSSGFYSGSGQISKAMVLSELEFTLGQKERALQMNPYDTISQNHVNVLQQLRKLVEAGVSQEELRQILSQLRNLVRSGPPPAPILQSFPSHQQSYPSQSYPPVLSTHPQSSYHQPPSYPQPPFPSLKSEALDVSSVLGSQMASASNSASGSSATSGSIADLFNALIKAGVVSASSTPTGAGATAKEEAGKPQSIDMEKDSRRLYRKLILSQKIKLTSADIAKTRPQVVNFLYDQLPSQCKQCGLRFADSTLGKRKMEDHLDMHFRQNRKANQNIGRGHSRSWFVGLEDWIHSTSADIKGKGRADGSRPLNAKAAAAAEAAKREAELRDQYVVVPPGDEAKPISCPICKETLKSEFLEDEEEWVWKNAVKKDERVFHATCHAEAVASTNNLAARLRSEVASRSRSSTPEVLSFRATPPKTSSHLKNELRSPSPPTESYVTGTKRKAEDGTALNTEADGSPPIKKLAMLA